VPGPSPRRNADIAETRPAATGQQTLPSRRPTRLVKPTTGRGHHWFQPALAI